jgi:hypothetical protein
MEMLRAFDDWFDVDHVSVPMVLPTVMVVVFPPFFPVPIPVPTMVSLPVNVIKLHTSDKPAMAESSWTEVPLDVVGDDGQAA